ncbi:MAG: hypothetical protein V3V82_00060 [Acidimicrobiia bacterium]
MVATLKETRNSAEQARLEREIAEDRAVARDLDGQGYTENYVPETVVMREAFGDIVSPWGFLGDAPNFPITGPFGQSPGGFFPSRRGDGRQSPLFTTSAELDQMRSAARWLFDTTATGQASIGALADYCIGSSGYDYTILDKVSEPGKAGPRHRSALANAVQGIVDEILEASDFVVTRERELFERAHVEGEAAATLYPGGLRGIPRLRITEPELITAEGASQAPNGRDISFGVDTLDDDVETVFGYIIDWPVGPAAYVPEAQLELLKLNVGSNVKRGVSDLFPLQSWLPMATKLLENMGQGGALQAAIAYIIGYPAGTTNSQLETLRSRGTERTVTHQTPNQGQKTVHQERQRPGSIVRTKVGQTYTAGPMGSSRAPNYVLIEQALLRMIGTRWRMPEAMISGDASNANFASSLVAESPFVRSCEAIQGVHAKSNERLIWKAVRMAAAAGRLTGFEMTWPDIRRALKMKVTPPRVSSRNALQETQRRQILNDKGILSDETWATQEDLDIEEERAEGAKASSVLPPFSPPRSLVGLPPAQPGGRVEEPVMAELVPEVPSA